MNSLLIFVQESLGWQICSAPYASPSTPARCANPLADAPQPPPTAWSLAFHYAFHYKKNKSDKPGNAALKCFPEASAGTGLDRRELRSALTVKAMKAEPEKCL